jgi:hypothetical protein
MCTPENLKESKILYDDSLRSRETEGDSSRVALFVCLILVGVLWKLNIGRFKIEQIT